MPDPAELFPPDGRTLPRLLVAQAERYGERPLLTAGETTWTFRDAPDIAARRAATLAAAGIQAGDRVAILCSNRAESLELFLGCGWLGAVAVPINTAAMGPQIAYCLGNSGARLLAAEAGLIGRLDHADLASAPLERIWAIGNGAPATAAGRPVEPLPAPGAPIPPAGVGPGDMLAILYTSGTTGPSKGVMSPHAQYFWWGVNTIRRLGIGGGEVLATTLPLFHINALNTFGQALLSGSRMVLEPRFSASGFWPAMARHGATVGYLLGAMVPILLAREPSAAERAHRMRVALGPGVPASLVETFAARTGVRLVEGYGSTETNFVIGGPPGSTRPGTMGRICDGFEARVVDEADVPVADGEAGELVLRAGEPFAFATGYFGMPDKTIEAWRNLWFHTGDRVVREADGSFRFVDRLKDAIRRRGENISSWEIEQVLASHPDVENVAVYPVRSELAEDEVMAAVVPRPGVALTAEALVAWCAPRLPYFAIPRFLRFEADLPRTENGKVQKYKLREQGVPPGTWDREAMRNPAERPGAGQPLPSGERSPPRSGGG